MYNPKGEVFYRFNYEKNYGKYIYVNITKNKVLLSIVDYPKMNMYELSWKFTILNHEGFEIFSTTDKYKMDYSPYPMSFPVLSKKIDIAPWFIFADNAKIHYFDNDLTSIISTNVKFEKSVKPSDTFVEPTSIKIINNYIYIDYFIEDYENNIEK